MIKGVSREVVEIGDMENSYFERAVLYVRPGMTISESSNLANEGAKYVQALTQTAKLKGKYQMFFPFQMALSASLGALITYILTIVI